MQISREQAIDQLQRWQEEGTAVWVYFTVHLGAAGLVMLARITDISACIVLSGEGAVLRFDLDKARFEYGPLPALLMPSSLGVVAAVSVRKKAGVLPNDGIHIRLESGHSLFICEGGPEQGALEFPLLGPAERGLL